MKNKTFGYIEDWKTSHMAYWVHIEADYKPWYTSENFDPPAPVRHGSLGYRYLTIELDGFRFSFTSEAQFEEFKTIMGRKLLPTTMELSNKRPGSKGPNSHWLSRLPAKTKPWRYREKLIKFCNQIDFNEN